jgi:TetR/AcrR family transcriptional regulator, transcriptional repressor for nem operon
MGRTSDARERLMRAAGELWHTRSYADVGVSEICDCAGVQKGSFYHFFPSKRDLALAVIDETWKRVGEGRAAAVLTGSLPPLERIVRYLEAGLEEQVRLKAETGAVPGCQFGNLLVETGNVDPVLRERLERLFADWTALMRRALDDAVAAGDLPAVDTDQAARALLAYVEGLAVLVKATDDPRDLADLIPLAIRLAGGDPEAVRGAMARA